MSALDIFLLVPIGYAAFRGFMKGFVLEVFSFIAFIVATIACIKLTSAVMEQLSGFISNSYLLPFVSYLLVFIGAFLLVIWLGKFIEMLVKMGQLGFINRIFGILVSTLKMCFFLSLLIWLADIAHLFSPETREASMAYRYLHNFAPALISGIGDYLPFIKDTVDGIENIFSAIVPEFTA